MDNTLLQSVYNQLKSAVSATTAHVYYLFLPSQELLAEALTVTYEIRNTDNESLFDSRDALRYYRVRVNLNSTSPTNFGTNSIYIRGKMSALTTVNTDVKYVRLLTEDVFYDNELNVFTSFLEFEVQAT